MFWMRSNIELDLETIFEGSLIAGKIVDMESNWSLSHIFEEDIGEFEEDRSIEFAADSNFSGQFVVRIVVFNTQQSFIEKSSFCVKDTLNKRMLTSAPTLMSLRLEITSNLRWSKYPVASAQLKPVLLKPLF